MLEADVANPNQSAEPPAGQLNPRRKADTSPAQESGCLVGQS